MSEPTENTTSTETGPRPGFAARLRALATGRHRRLFRAGVAVAALALFVLLPGWIATRPAFLGRYPDLAAPYRTWSTSVHATVPCQRCHVAPDLLSQTVFDARMVGEFYLAVVPGRSFGGLAVPTNAACFSCHFEQRTVSPSGDLNIPHRAHVEVLKLACVQCHAYLVHEKSPEGKHTPTMAACLKCHDGRQARNACATCHTNKAAPPSHATADWLVAHASHRDDPACRRCHAWTAHWCADCHARRPKSHGSDWRVAHAAAVKVHRDCEACHAGNFCVRCHGEVPAANRDTTLTLVR